MTPPGSNAVVYSPAGSGPRVLPRKLDDGLGTGSETLHRWITQIQVGAGVPNEISRENRELMSRTVSSRDIEIRRTATT